MILGLKFKIRTNFCYQVKVICILRLNFLIGSHEEDIGLISISIMYLFDRFSYIKLSEREIEGYSTMKGLLTYPSECIAKQ